MRIVDASQNIVTSYDYDSYGKVISATGTLANITPLRYRGYVYDQETGFYYLQSRYYDPTILAFGAVSYIITVRTETRTRGVWFWKHEQTRYVAEVMVSDFYNFDSKPWSGLGNILNNGAAILHCVGVGKDYYWEANYSYATKWERSS